MKNKLAPLLIIFMVYVAFIFYESATLDHENPEYQNYIAEYRRKVDEALLKTQKQNTTALSYVPSRRAGTASNFEGPQVLLKAIKFHNEVLDKEDERLKHFDGLSAIFDPDHSHYGLPDVKISIKDVRLYQPDDERFSNFLNFKDTPKPYRTYRKTLVSDSTQKPKVLEMQLWLTEFDVTVDVRPDLDTRNSKRKEDTTITYPGFWYGLHKKRVNLEDLQAEYKDQRYGNLAFILEVIPDGAPIYVDTGKEKPAKADFAVGAIYCTKALIGNEEKVQRINTNIHSGQPVYMNHEVDFDKMNENPGIYAETITGNIDKVMNATRHDDVFIWNKPYYLKLHFTNLGTWRSGLVNQNKFHDQVTYSFLMPVFVVGRWEVIAPQELLPKWAPPAPYIRKLTLNNLLPFWAKGLFGKMVAIALVVLLIFTLMQFVAPRLGSKLKRVFFK